VAAARVDVDEIDSAPFAADPRRAASTAPRLAVANPFAVLKCHSVLFQLVLIFGGAAFESVSAA
jgi:hypothetical protein